MKLDKCAQKVLVVLTALWLFAASVPCVLSAPRVKVHKQLIRVVAPNEKGVVHVLGLAGAIESTSTVRLEIRNLTQKNRRPVKVLADGSFSAPIAANPGDQVRVLARNTERKRSYGTFTVPDAKAVGDPEALAVGPETLPNGVVAKPLSADAESMHVGVFINVVDLKTGELLASQKVEGVLERKLQPEFTYMTAINNLIAKCLNVVRTEMGIARRDPILKAHPADEKASTSPPANPQDSKKVKETVPPKTDQPPAKAKDVSPPKEPQA